MCNEEFFQSERQRARGLYTKARQNGFESRDDLSDWFVSQLKEQKCKCYFCETSIHDINRLIDAKLIAKRKTGKGFRGPVLEIDKNEDNYTKELCVLACHYCNNDKSNLMSKEQYKAHFGPNRKKYFDGLLEQLNQQV